MRIWRRVPMLISLFPIPGWVILYLWQKIRSINHAHPHATMATSCPAPTMAAEFVQESAWALHLRCASVGGSEQAVSSTSRLHEPTLSVQSCLLLDSEAAAELGEAEISDDAESFGTSTGSHGWSRDRQGLSDQHPMQASKQWQARRTGITLQPTLTHYTQWHWSQLLAKKFLPRAHVHQLYAFDE